MVTLLATFFVVAIVHSWRWVRDRGTREYVAWFLSQEEYVAYVSELDRTGYLIRDWVGRVMRARPRLKFTQAILLQGGVLLGYLTVAQALHWPNVWAVIPVGIVIAGGAVLDGVTMKARGIDQFGLSTKYWGFVVVASIIAAVLAWSGLVALLDAAFDANVNLVHRSIRWLAAIGALAFSVLVVDVSMRAAVRGDRRPLFARETSSESVLFLRSFSDDGVVVYAPTSGQVLSRLCGNRVSFERFVAQCILENGKLIAIGKPGDRLPPLGAARTYWPDDQWQDAVKTTAARAKAIILVAGSSEGLAWEVRQLRSWGLLSKALFLLPPLGDEEANLRLRRLLKDLDTPHDMSQKLDKVYASTLLGVRVDPSSRLILHTANGRDWANYLGTVVCFFRELDGSMIPPAPGELSKLNGYD